MIVSAECVLVKDGGVWRASLPQFGGLSAAGKTREQALGRARELLRAEVARDPGRARQPRMRHLAEVSVVSVDTAEGDGDRSGYIMKSRAAERLGVTASRVTALVASGQLETRAFDGRELVSVASVERYEATPRHAGRKPKVRKKPEVADEDA